MLLRKIVIAVAPLFFAVIFSHAAQAASFDCAKARSKQEKLICSTPALSQADDVMAAKYKKAHAAAGKISQEEASQLKDNQWGWIMIRSWECTQDVKCLSKSYKERIAFLDFYLLQTQKPKAVSGTYERNDRGNTAELQVRPDGGNKIMFNISAIYIVNQGTAAQTANSGDIKDKGELKNGVMNFNKQMFDEPCKLLVSFSVTKAVIKQEGSCGFGFNVYADGVYFKTSNAVPKIKADPEDINN